MPLLSRFRKTVTSAKPKTNGNSNGKSSNSAEHSYQRSTKSSAEKSLKPSNTFRAYMNTDNHSSSRNGQHSNNTKSIAIDYSRDVPHLRRSSTFTLDDEEVENLPERFGHATDRRGDVSANDEFRHRNTDYDTYGRNRGKLVYSQYLHLQCVRIH